MSPMNRPDEQELVPQPSAATSGRRLPFAVGALLLGLGLLGGWLLSGHGRHGDGLDPEIGPVVVAMRKLGQLHTVSYTMRDVVRQQSQQEPDGITSHLPGAESVVHWATKNEALVVAEGNVEAGVDLSQLSDRDITRVQNPEGKTTLRVHLPPVTVYPPNVHVRVENSHSGLLWHDKNLIPKAQAQAGRRFEQAAEQQNIRQTAEINAVQALKKMQSAFGQNNIEFFFTEPSALAVPPGGHQ